MQVSLDLNKCKGYVCCVVAAPEVFDVDDDTGLATLKMTEVDGDELVSKTQQAVNDCPTGAIALHER